MTAFFEGSHLFPSEDRAHECLPCYPFARLNGLTPRMTELDISHAVMHYEEPADIKLFEDEAVVRFKTRNEAKLFLGKCPQLCLYGESLTIEELKMDEAAELIRHEIKYSQSAPTSLGCSRAGSMLPSRAVSRAPSRNVSRGVSRAQSRHVTPIMSRVASEGEESEEE